MYMYNMYNVAVRHVLIHTKGLIVLQEYIIKPLSNLAQLCVHYKLKLGYQR